MTERIVYECKWCGPVLSTPKERSFTYYLLKPDVHEFIDSMSCNSWMEIRPIQVDIMSDQYMESMRWRQKRINFQEFFKQEW